MEKSYADLKQIAVDMAENKIFSNLHINRLDYRSMIIVFMPLIFIDDKCRKDLVDREIVFVYEYYEEAMPRGVNGMPCFGSMRMLTKSEYETMWIEYENYVKMKKAFLDDFEPVIPFEVGKNFLTKEDLNK